MQRKIIASIVIMMLLSVLIAGCGEKLHMKETRESAEKYLAELKNEVNDTTLALTEDDVEYFGDIISFTVTSQKCGDSFKINVNTDNSVTDSYFAVDLSESTKSEFSEMVKVAFSDKNIDYELSIEKNIVSSALSKKKFTSIHEAQNAIGSDTGLVNVSILQKIDEDTLKEFIDVMQSNGFFGDLSVTDDVREFRISENEVKYTRCDDMSGEVIFYDYD